MFQKTRTVVGTLVLSGALLSATVLSAVGQPPAGKGEPPMKGEKGKGGPGGRGMRPPIGAVLPPHLVEELNFTDEQKKDLAELQKDVDAKLAKILTDDQKKQLKEMKDRGPGGPGGKGGPGGPGGKGGPGGPGEKGGKGERPPVE